MNEEIWENGKKKKRKEERKKEERKKKKKILANPAKHSLFILFVKNQADGLVIAVKGTETATKTSLPVNLYVFILVRDSIKNTFFYADSTLVALFWVQ